MKTAVFLDGGYFLDPPPPGGDQADIAPHMKKPVLMLNGRYDYTFSLGIVAKSYVHNARNPGQGAYRPGDATRCGGPTPATRQGCALIGSIVTSGESTNKYWAV